MGNNGLTVYGRALRRAADILGGKDALRARLHVPIRQLEQWLDGTAMPPTDVFLSAVDIISGPQKNTPPAAATVRAKVLKLQTAELIADTRRVVAQARALRDTGLARRSTPCVASFLATVFGPHERLAMLESALEAAVAAGHTDMGNVQLKLDDGLHIVAQRGFKEPFLEFFDRVDHDHCACGTAIKAGARVVVPDVAAHPIFTGTEAARVMQAAGVRAVQSTPLIGTTGIVLGMLSTHYDHPYAPPLEELEAVDLIATRATYWLEQLRA